MVEANGLILEKPDDEQHAFAMISRWAEGWVGRGGRGEVRGWVVRWVGCQVGGWVGGGGGGGGWVGVGVGVGVGGGMGGCKYQPTLNQTKLN